MGDAPAAQQDLEPSAPAIDIVARLAKKHGAALVKFQSAFDEACRCAPAEYWIWDGVHRTYSGHQIMAEAWERTVREF